MSTYTENFSQLNLTETVGRNTDLLNKLLQGQATLAQFGIHVKGIVETADDLPDPSEGDPGDAYLVGTAPIGAQDPSYLMYVLTLLADDSQEWINIGRFPGKGETGQTGISVQSAAISANYHLILTLSNGTTVDAGYVRGPKGEVGPSTPGPKGEQGYTPYIGANGNWFINGVDTLKPSRGETGPQSTVPGPKGDTGIMWVVQNTTPLSSMSAITEEANAANQAAGHAWIFYDSTETHIAGIVGNEAIGYEWYDFGEAANGGRGEPGVGITTMNTFETEQSEDNIFETVNGFRMASVAQITYGDRDPATINVTYETSVPVEAGYGIVISPNGEETALTIDQGDNLNVFDSKPTAAVQPDFIGQIGVWDDGEVVHKYICVGVGAQGTTWSEFSESKKDEVLTETQPNQYTQGSTGSGAGYEIANPLPNTTYYLYQEDDRFVLNDMNFYDNGGNLKFKPGDYLKIYVESKDLLIDDATGNKLFRSVVSGNDDRTAAGLWEINCECVKFPGSFTHDVKILVVANKYEKGTA